MDRGFLNGVGAIRSLGEVAPNELVRIWDLADHSDPVFSRTVYHEETKQLERVG